MGKLPELVTHSWYLVAKWYHSAIEHGTSERALAQPCAGLRVENRQFARDLGWTSGSCDTLKLQP